MQKQKKVKNDDVAVEMINLENINEDTIDTFLASRGMPDDVLNNLSYRGEYTIYTTLEDDSIFDGYSERKAASLPSSDGDFSVQFIPTSDLEFDATGWRNTDGTYSIYPSFYWKENVELDNDSFGFALNKKYWDNVSGATLNLWMRDFGPEGSTTSYFIDRASMSDYSGHSFKMSGLGSFPHDYEGNGYFKAKPVGSTIDRTISISYADGKSILGNISYGVNIGMTSVTYSSSANNFKSTADIIGW
ncbi:hypothetical protein HMI01_08340 [Halolactibacillus miurensis]|uniref:Uncharacterized protein n=1 Tax=Halolactibacillus miurensis TaxID=306541 RepID=A0ABQ0VRQ7_9BACI|nr:hypothetical protein [Halolactibacillus miurensis]GEM03846.1 hypothetical protein HMI01_08340 [Halolactibacillus miurensis]